MAVSMSPKQKVYQAVLNEIRRYIDENNLKPGDKLPSERDLAENLQAGRSSVREALRAMELLGLIETRSGQGTFLSDYKPYQTVELLASFILQGAKTKRELRTAKVILEKEITKLTFHRIDQQDVNEMEMLVTENLEEKHTYFFRLLLKKTDNLLLTRIWNLMEDFSLTMKQSNYDKMFYEELIDIYINRSYDAVEKLFGNYME
ncbi:GntR family transcriptional regulator [Virgibacillus phasianinus]|uniref:GntR family transcriptional regulator n=1 Tax=Virgibacillus phasianinus TaxID=2017483 RepID=A0A220U4G3_9BACI|nr:GntR family transcriptional regulator [Virgibacillus phasianinus]ASK62980.1 GntR family transcriptional regulator [Virgibacillus phasianinus]